MPSGEKKYNVLVVGELNMDLILTGMDKFPKLNTEIFSSGMTLTMGSSAAIMAANLSILNTTVAFVGRIGCDQFGDYVISTLKEKGVNTAFITRSKTSKTGLTVAMSYGNERAMVTYPGAMLELKQEDVGDGLLRNYQHLHVSSIFMQPGLKQRINLLFKRAKKAGLTTSLDTQWDPAEKWDCDWQTLLPLVDIFLPNLEEIKALTKQGDVESAIDFLKDYSNTIIVKCSTEGSVAWSENKLFRQSAFLNSEVKDTVGAGDSFNAGVIHHFIRGKAIGECMEFGAICGAINTTAPGGTAAFGSIQTVKDISRKKFNYIINDL